MPIYDYHCDHCGHAFSAVKSFTDAPVDRCPSCGKHPRKLMATPAIVFKGGGWYKTDSRPTPQDGALTASKDGSGTADQAGSSSGAKDGSAAGEAKADTKSDRKAETKGETKAETKAETKTRTETKTESGTKAEKPAAPTPKGGAASS